MGQPELDPVVDTVSSVLDEVHAGEVGPGQPVPAPRSAAGHDGVQIPAPEQIVAPHSPIRELHAPVGGDFALVGHVPVVRPGLVIVLGEPERAADGDDVGGRGKCVRPGVQGARGAAGTDFIGEALGDHEGTERLERQEAGSAVVDPPTSAKHRTRSDAIGESDARLPIVGAFDQLAREPGLAGQYDREGVRRPGGMDPLPGELVPHHDGERLGIEVVEHPILVVGNRIAAPAQPIGEVQFVGDVPIVLNERAPLPFPPGDDGTGLIPGRGTRQSQQEVRERVTAHGRCRTGHGVARRPVHP